MLADNFGKMRGNDRSLIHHGVTRSQGLFLHAWLDPLGCDAEGRFARIDSFEGGGVRVRANG